MKFKKKKRKKHSFGNYIFIGIIVYTYAVLGILLVTKAIPDTFPDSVMDVFQKISIVCASLVFLFFICYGLLSIFYNNKKKKYEKLIQNIGKKHISKVTDNSEIFLVENELENEEFAERYKEYKIKEDKLRYAEKVVFSILLAITVISIDIPILLWVTILFIAIILARDSVSSYLAEFSINHKKK